MINKFAKRLVKYILGSLMVVLFLSPKLFAQDDLNDLIVQRKNVQKQVDAMAKNDKTFKNKASYADYLSTYKKLMDIDEQIILAANYSMNSLVKERDEALKKAASGGGVKTVFKTVPTFVAGKSNDSLANAVTSLQFQTSNLNNVLKAKDEALMRLATKSDSLETENKKFTSQFQSLEVDNKNLGEKNLILMIFNSLVVIALIMSLFFLLRKPVAKKLMFNEPTRPVNTHQEPHPVIAEVVPVAAAPVPVQPPPLQEPERIIRKAPEVNRPEPVFKVSSEGILSGTHDGLDLKLDQIEKLARLKEKGYLTDEEFNTQKRQILGS